MIKTDFYNKIVNASCHKAVRKLHRKIFSFPANWMDANGEAANELIKETLLSDNPCLIARFGKTEIEAVMASLYQNKFMPPWTRLYRFLSWDVPYKGWQGIAPKLCNLSGVFPADEVTLHMFAETYLSAMPEIDILGSWLHAEQLLAINMPSVKRIPILDMEPFFFQHPWSQVLQGKRVLVIHPFTKSIAVQLKKRSLLFDNPNILPDFDLIPLQAVQSLGGGGRPPICLVV